MSQFHIHPDNYNEEEIVEIKKIALLDTKLAMLVDLIEPIELLEDADLKFDLETKIAGKISRLVDKI
jgi:hypothetical protein